MKDFCKIVRDGNEQLLLFIEYDDEKESYELLIKTRSKSLKGIITFSIHFENEEEAHETLEMIDFKGFKKYLFNVGQTDLL